MNIFLRKLHWLMHRREKEAELREELQFHLAEEAEECRAEGSTNEEAERAARCELGNLTLIEEDTRAVWRWPLIEQFGQDVRYAFRTMATNRLFTLLAILSLALGIGANTAIYSFMDAILLRSLPVRDPQSLVVLNWRAKWAYKDSVMHGMSGSTWGDSKSGETGGIFPYPAFELFRKSDSVLSSVFAHFQFWESRRLNVAIRGQADIASGWSVSGDYFRGLGVAPAAGRLILPDDDRPGASAVVVASYGFSQRHFGEAGNAVDQQVLIDNVPFTVVGIAPPEFFGVDPSGSPELYFPMHANELLGAGHQFGFTPDAYLAQNYYWTQIMGRLRPGISLAEAQAQLAPVFRQWVASTASNDGERANLPELVVKEGAGGLDSLRRRYSKPLYVLLTLVGLILALACANVANLLLARAAVRRREIALRLSVGASRARVLRQLLTESVLLASLGGTLGVFLALWGIRFLTLLLASGRANFTLRADLNWHVLAVAAALSLVTGVLFGLAPAFQAIRVDVMPALKELRGGSAGRLPFFRRVSLSQMLVAGQIAITLVLLFAAGLFVRTLSNLESIDVGFNRENVLLFQIDARKAGHKDPEISSFYGDLRERFRAIPGVREASLSEDSLIEAGTGLPLGISGEPPNPENRILSVGPEFFRTMQIPILEGRDLEERDRAGSPAVAVVNEAFVKANFERRNPLGQHLIMWKASGENLSRQSAKREGEIARDMEIIGVCRNATYGSLTRTTPPVAYLPYDQGYPEVDHMVYALRTLGDPLRYVNAVRATLRQTDARIPISEVRTQVAEINQTVSQEITFAGLCSGFATLALVIACVGLYGTISYSVVQRTSEIGIRMALGAQRGRVLQMILREVLALAGAGLVIGGGTALAASRFVESLLWGITHNDPRSLALAVATLLVAALLAGYLPAYKASRIDLMGALRHE
jgi:macrolide transport system ATP-binding/permease protein